jgi:hypothetical protein
MHGNMNMDVAPKTIDNEMINLTKLHYLLLELHSMRPKIRRIKQALIDIIYLQFVLVCRRQELSLSVLCS